MSTDKDLHDPELSRLYKELPPLTPRPETDAEILAAARRAVHAGPRRRWIGWSSGMATAAGLVLVVGVLVHNSLPVAHKEEAPAAEAPAAGAPPLMADSGNAAGYDQAPARMEAPAAAPAEPEALDKAMAMAKPAAKPEAAPAEDRLAAAPAPEMQRAAPAAAAPMPAPAPAVIAMAPVSPPAAKAKAREAERSEARLAARAELADAAGARKEADARVLALQKAEKGAAEKRALASGLVAEPVYDHRALMQQGSYAEAYDSLIHMGGGSSPWLRLDRDLLGLLTGHRAALACSPQGGDTLAAEACVLLQDYRQQGQLDQARLEDFAGRLQSEGGIHLYWLKALHDLK